MVTEPSGLRVCPGRPFQSIASPATGMRSSVSVTSPPIVGLAEPLVEALRAGGAAVGVYAEIATEPAVATVEAAMAAARAFEPDAVVGLGGGSAIDVANVIAPEHLQLMTADAEASMGGLAGGMDLGGMLG